MEILGIGLSELVFIVIIILIVLGPKDMQKAGKTLGKWMNGIITSSGWRALKETTNELRQLPVKMMREANLDGFDPNAPPPDPYMGSTRRRPANSKPGSTPPAANYAFPENSIAAPPEQEETESDQPDNA